MKKIILLLAVVIASVTNLSAQHFAVIDMEYITNHIPQLKKANEDIERQTQKWKLEIEGLKNRAKALYEDYQKNANTMTPQQKQLKEEEIIKTEKEAANLRMTIFGPKGKLFQMREKLINPYQEKISKAVEALSKANNIYAVIDKTSTNGFVYLSPDIDISDAVLKTLGN